MAGRAANIFTRKNEAAQSISNPHKKHKKEQPNLSSDAGLSARNLAHIQRTSHGPRRSSLAGMVANDSQHGGTDAAAKQHQPEKDDEKDGEENANGSALLFQGSFLPPTNGNNQANNEATSKEKDIRAIQALTFKDQVVVAGRPLRGHTDSRSHPQQGVADAAHSENHEQDEESIQVGLAVLIEEGGGETGSHGTFPIAEVEEINPFFQKKFVLTLAGMSLLGIALAVALPLALIEQTDPITPAPSMAPTSASIGDGFCDAEFNVLEFNWDGGDCCERTCEAPTPFAGCGKGDDGFTYVGYDSCLPAEPSEGNIQPVSNAFPIDSAEAFARSGASVAISPNGQVLLVGGYGSNEARLFDKDGSLWRQRGATLEGPPGSEFGRSVAMSVGSGAVTRVSNQATRVPVTIAVGGPAHADNGGIARVYDCLTDGCIQVGVDIVGRGGNRFFSDHLGQSLDMSNDGGLLAVVAQRVGVQTYERSEGNGGYILRDTLGAPSSSHTPLYVTMSGDGDTLAVGYLEFRLFDAPTPFESVLTTIVYNDAGSNNWTEAPNGNMLSQQGHHIYSFSRQRYPQSSVRLSKSGSVLAIASRFEENAVQILHTVNGTWETRGVITASFGPNSTEDQFGWGLAISEDGSKIAVASNETVRLFQWNGTNHESSSKSFPAGEESVVDLARDASVVVVGLPFSQANLGGRTISYGNMSPPCPETKSHLRLSLTTGINADEIRWSLADKSGLFLREGGPYDTDGLEATFTEDICVDDDTMEDGCAVFTIVNGGGDVSLPSYFLFLDGEEVLKSGNPSFASHDKFEQLRLGKKCACDEGQAEFRLVLETDQEPEETSWTARARSLDGPLLLSGGPYQSSEERTVVVSQTCVAEEECVVFTIRDANRNGFGTDDTGNIGLGGYTLFWNGEEAASSRWDWNIEAVDRVGTSCRPTVPPTPVPIECDEDSMPVRVELELGQAPSDTSWMIVDSVDEETLLEGGPFNRSHRNGVFSNATCVRRDGCSVLTVRTSFLGVRNILVSVDGEEVYEGDTPFGDAAEILQIGNCMPPAETLAPTTAPTLVTVCPAGWELFQFIFTTDALTEGTSWDLIDPSGDVILEGGPYNAPSNGFETFASEICVSSTSCTTLSIRFCCGRENVFSFGTYSASLGGSVIASGGAALGGLETVQFGSNCSSAVTPGPNVVDIEPGASIPGLDTTDDF